MCSVLWLFVTAITISGWRQPYCAIWIYVTWATGVTESRARSDDVLLIRFLRLNTSFVTWSACPRSNHRPMAHSLTLHLAEFIHSLSFDLYPITAYPIHWSSFTCHLSLNHVLSNEVLSAHVGWEHVLSGYDVSRHVLSVYVRWKHVLLVHVLAGNDAVVSACLIASHVLSVIALSDDTELGHVSAHRSIRPCSIGSCSMDPCSTGHVLLAHVLLCHVRQSCFPLWSFAHCPCSFGPCSVYTYPPMFIPLLIISHVLPSFVPPFTYLSPVFVSHTRILSVHVSYAHFLLAHVLSVLA